MAQPIQRVSVEVDTFRVASESLIFLCQLEAALAVCVHDDTQAVGGLLHLRYVATSNDKPLDLTDNTLSSGLLLMDRFCKELRAMGARKCD
jgi:chemotaxis receptor (MCP) glutamine deamidase CheD